MNKQFEIRRLWFCNFLLWQVFTSYRVQTQNCPYWQWSIAAALCFLLPCRTSSERRLWEKTRQACHGFLSSHAPPSLHLLLSSNVSVSEQFNYELTCVHLLSVCGQTEWTRSNIIWDEQSSLDANLLLCYVTLAVCSTSSETRLIAS